MERSSLKNITNYCLQIKNNMIYFKRTIVRKQKIKEGGIIQNEEQRIYIAIDLKSFYASVECVERSLDPLTTNLVVADNSRTEKTVCLAVTPSLKAYGLSGRSRLYQVVQRIKEVNIERRIKCKEFIGKSYNDIELKKDSRLELDYIIAPPRMGLYMKYSTNIYKIYYSWSSMDYINNNDFSICTSRHNKFTNIKKKGKKDKKDIIIHICNNHVNCSNFSK